MKITKLPSLQTQVGGTHYKNQNYELAQFSLDIGLNPMLHSALKYILRDKDDKKQDLQKAAHCCTIFVDWVKQQYSTGKWRSVSVWDTKFDFNTINTFIEQYEPTQQTAMLAVLKIQSELQVSTDISASFAEAIKLDVALLEENLATALNLINNGAPK